MFFKRLEIVGFKSFGNKTVFEFEPGISAIVGPNGCGKSNVADAIRWVLGEQSAKSLRGTRMEDVIFNGTDERSAINMAEVSFTIEDPGKTLSLGFHEVTVTRRVFRDGQSEYFINKAPCRLRDIRETFMDTGIGTDAYSILEQGKMDIILNAKAQERREVFEEAAGIHKYRAKKTEALRKLEHTEENLVRATDIMKEVKRQIQSVQRYASKARTYRRVYDEMKAMHVAHSRHRFELLDSEYKKVQEELSKIYQGQEARATQSEVDKGCLESIRENLRSFEERYEVVREESSKLTNEINRRENQAGMEEERLADLKASVARWDLEISGNHERVQKLEKDLEVAAEQVEQLTALRAATQEDVNHRDSVLRQLQERIKTVTRQHKERQEQLLEEELSSTRAKNQIGGLATSHKATVIGRERLLAEEEDLAEKIAQVEEAVANAKDEMSFQKEKTARVEGNVRLGVSGCEEIQAEIDVCQEKIEKGRESLARKKTKLELLNRWRAEGGDRKRSVQWLLDKRNEDSEAWKGLVGTVSDFLKVDSGYERAAEAVLGQWIEDLVVVDGTWMEKVRETLSVENLGKISLVALQDVSHEEEPAPLEDARVLGPLRNFMKVDACVASHLQPWIQRTYVVKSWADARALAQEKSMPHGSALGFVTLKGEYVEPTGRATLGHGAEESPSVLGHDLEVKKLAEQVEHLSQSLHDALLEKGGFVVEKDRQVQGIAQLQEALKQEEIRNATLQKEIEKLLLHRNQLRNDQSVVSRELERAKLEDDRYSEEYHKHQCTLENFEKSHAMHKADFEGLGQELEEVAAKREGLLEEVTRSKIQLASSEEKLENCSRQKRDLEDRLEELRSLCQSKESETSQSTERIAQLEKSIGEWKAIQEGLLAQNQERQAVLQELTEQRKVKVSEGGELERKLAQVQKEMVGMTDRQRTLEVERAQQEGQKDHIRENLLREFQVDLQAPLPMEAGTFTLEPDQTWDNVAERVAQARKKLEGMGPVNVAAMEEHDELQSRYDFLVKEHEDLVAAKETLLKVISRINTTTRKLFAETFEQIRKNFQEVFVKLFGGGKADLLLTDEGNILEAGIDIIAKPPGKQLRSITLLSGGEKALTAIALLFAIFQVKPSPFSLLDEIDAPLDESNIVRFVNMLKDYSEKTQFIVITHSKRTIAEADVLYGITMQESGISKVVSVRLTDREQAGKFAVTEIHEKKAPVSPFFKRQASEPPSDDTMSAAVGPALKKSSGNGDSVDKKEGSAE